MQNELSAVGGNRNVFVFYAHARNAIARIRHDHNRRAPTRDYLLLRRRNRAALTLGDGDHRSHPQEGEADRLGALRHGGIAPGAVVADLRLIARQTAVEERNGHVKAHTFARVRIGLQQFKDRDVGLGRLHDVGDRLRLIAGAVSVDLADCDPGARRQRIGQNQLVAPLGVKHRPLHPQEEFLVDLPVRLIREVVVVRFAQRRLGRRVRREFGAHDKGALLKFLQRTVREIRLAAVIAVLLRPFLPPLARFVEPGHQNALTRLFRIARVLDLDAGVVALVIEIDVLFLFVAERAALEHIVVQLAVFGKALRPVCRREIHVTEREVEGRPLVLPVIEDTGGIAVVQLPDHIDIVEREVKILFVARAVDRGDARHAAVGAICADGRVAIGVFDGERNGEVVVIEICPQVGKTAHVVAADQPHPFLHAAVQDAQGHTARLPDTLLIAADQAAHVDIEGARIDRREGVAALQQARVRGVQCRRFHASDDAADVPRDLAGMDTDIDGTHAIVQKLAGVVSGHAAADHCALLVRADRDLTDGMHAVNFSGGATGEHTDLGSSAAGQINGNVAQDIRVPHLARKIAEKSHRADAAPHTARFRDFHAVDQVLVAAELTLKAADGAPKMPVEVDVIQNMHRFARERLAPFREDDQSRQLLRRADLVIAVFAPVIEAGVGERLPIFRVPADAHAGAIVAGRGRAGVLITDVPVAEFGFRLDLAVHIAVEHRADDPLILVVGLLDRARDAAYLAAGGLDGDIRQPQILQHAVAAPEEARLVIVARDGHIADRVTVAVKRSPKSRPEIIGHVAVDRHPVAPGEIDVAAEPHGVAVKRANLHRDQVGETRQLLGGRDRVFRDTGIVEQRRILHVIPRARFDHQSVRRLYGRRPSHCRCERQQQTNGEQQAYDALFHDLAPPSFSICG